MLIECGKVECKGQWERKKCKKLGRADERVVQDSNPAAYENPTQRAVDFTDFSPT